MPKNAFGESNTKSQVKKVIYYKKPTVWLVISSVVVAIVVGIALLSNPLNDASSAQTPSPIVVQGNGESGSFSILDNGILYPSGNIISVYYSLPGYKAVPIDMHKDEDSILAVFELLASARRWDYSEEYVPLTGASLHIEYADAANSYQVDLYTHSDGKRILFNPYPITEGPGTMVSEELCRLIHDLSNWKPFDMQQIVGVDAMKVQTVPSENGTQEQTSIDTEAIVIEGAELNELIDLLVTSAKVDDEGRGAYNVSVILMKNGIEMYHGYLCGSNKSTMIHFETQYFRVDKEFIRRIYQKIGLTDTGI